MWFTVYIRRKASDGTYSNNVFTYATENEANHQFWATLSTYGNDNTYDFIRCFTMDEAGAVIRNDFVDKRQPAQAE